jgi:septation ring formation regulator EzrA
MSEAVIIVLLLIALGVTGAILFRTRSHLAAVEADFHASREQVAGLKAMLQDLHAEARGSGVTTMALIKAMETLTEGLQEVSQISPRLNQAQRRAIIADVRQRMEQRVQALEHDAAIQIFTNGRYTVNPVIIEQIESFTSKLESMQAQIEQIEQYRPTSTGSRGAAVNDLYIKKIVENWYEARAAGLRQLDYCRQHNIAPRTFSRYQQIYRERRLDLLRPPDSP